jgi:outer membrane protein TolC
MNKRLAALGIILSLLSLGVLEAQEKKPISLNEAISLSLRNSKQLKNSQAKIEEATAALREAVEKRLPDAKISGSWMWLSNANIDVKSKTNTGNQNGSPQVSQAMYGMLNASLPIYSGGRIRYGIESSRYLAQQSWMRIMTRRK